MKKLPLELYHECQAVLLECDEFQSNNSLKAVFRASPLREYTYKIPDADTRDYRVIYCLDFLSGRGFKEEPALALFLETLSSRYPAEDDVAIKLNQLAQQVRLAWSGSPAQPAPPVPTPIAPMLYDRRETASSSAPTTADVGIIFALEEEFREIFRQFAGNYIPVRDEETDNYYYQFQYPAAGTTSRYRCITTFVGGMGPVKAGIITEKLFSKWKPRLLVILGVAAALDDEVKLGDVVVADQVNMYLENSKAVPTGGGEDFTFQLSPESYRSSHDVLSLVQHLEFAHQKNFLDWQKHGATELQQLPAQKQIAALAQQGAIHEQPEVHVGHVASGSSVGAALAFKSWLRKQDCKYLALEMETGGFMEAVYQRTNLLHQQISPATLVLRAISDPGDENKKSLDNISKGIFRAYSLHNAIRLLWSILDTGFLPLS